MSKNQNFFITSLDQGYILNDNGQKIAFQNASSLTEHLTQRFTKSIERLSHSGIRNMSISIEVDENVPEEAKTSNHESI